MHRLIIASMRASAGKTSMIVGLGQRLGKRAGYLKPFGDRLLYRKKRLWDYDAALVASVLGLDENPEDMSLGFDHSKLRFMYDADSTKEKLNEVLSRVEQDADVVFIEGGKHIGYGISVHLDALTLARYTGGALVIVLSGDEDAILDDVTFIQAHLDVGDLRFGGVIINKVHDREDFRNTHLPLIAELGIPVRGVVPYVEELTHLSLGLLADALFAKVIAGEGGLDRDVKSIVVGASSTDAARRHPLFNKREKLVVTSGDRSDMILAALESGSAGIVVTNNIFPPPNILSMATDRNTPLLLASADTYEVAKQLDDIEALLGRDEKNKIERLAKLVEEYVDLEAILSS